MKQTSKKYYQIKKYNPKLKGNWYDMANYNITLYQYLHSKDVTDFIKEFLRPKLYFRQDLVSMFMMIATIIF